MEKKLLLLGLLRRQDMHGYQLNEFIDHNLSLCTDLKKPTAYYLLDQMHRDGWITAETGREGKRPPRRIYHLTDSGEAAFQRLLHEALSQYTPSEFAADVGLAFLDSLTKDKALPLLETQRGQIQARLDEVCAIPAHGGSLDLIFSHQKRHLQAELDWLDELMHQLNAAS